MQKPIISILMPVYNAEAYLSECLNSIQAQDYSNWELLAVNDQSTDQSLSILNAFAESDHRVRVFNTQDKGIIPALRMAYENSSGSWITRMDADDRMPTHKLSSLLNALDQKPGQVATGLVEYFSENGSPGPGFLRYADWLNQLTRQSRNFEAIYQECVIPSPCWMMHRDDLDRIGGMVRNRYPEDYDLVFRMYQANLIVIGIPEVLHHWRDHSDRASRTDPNYSDQQFLDLKMDYFFQIDRKRNKPLLLWGAGRKGKKLARMLVDRSEAFTWVTDNPKKQGHWIYDQQVQNPDLLDLNDFQLLISISSPEALTRLRERLIEIDDVIELYP